MSSSQWTVEMASNNFSINLTFLLFLVYAKRNGAIQQTTMILVA